MIEKANPKLWKSKLVETPVLATRLYLRLKHAEVPLELLVIAEGFETRGIVDLSNCRSLRRGCIQQGSLPIAKEGIFTVLMT
jgi:hypothetical protein